MDRKKMPKKSNRRQHPVHIAAAFTPMVRLTSKNCPRTNAIPWRKISLRTNAGLERKGLKFRGSPSKQRGLGALSSWEGSGQPRLTVRFWLPQPKRQSAPVSPSCRPSFLSPLFPLSLFQGMSSRHPGTTVPSSRETRASGEATARAATSGPSLAPARAQPASCGGAGSPASRPPPAPLREQPPYCCRRQRVPAASPGAPRPPRAPGSDRVTAQASAGLWGRASGLREPAPAAPRPAGPGAELPRPPRPPPLAAARPARLPAPLRSSRRGHGRRSRTIPGAAAPRAGRAAVAGGRRLGTHHPAHQRRAQPAGADQRGLEQVRQRQPLRGRRGAALHPGAAGPPQRAARAAAGRRRPVPGHHLVHRVQGRRGGALHERPALRRHGKGAASRGAPG